MQYGSAARDGRIPAPTQLTLPRRERLILTSGLVLLAAVAWTYMLYDHWRMHSMPMSEMWMPPTGSLSWAAADFWFTFVMWSVMMVAMMVPTAVPMITMYAVVAKNQAAANDAYARISLFILGYVVAWGAFSMFATLVQWFLHGGSLLTPMMENNSRLLAGLVLTVAGVYQFTPWKDVCLAQCRTPLGFLLTEWRDGRTGGIIMGFKHGAFCVGCCWALMLILFAVGVMNMLWVVGITGFVLAEKLIPAPVLVIRATSGCLLIGWGVWLLSGSIV